MRAHRTTVAIAAPVEQVWAVTYDIESWPSWSPTMRTIIKQDKGSLVAGSTARVEQPRLRPAVWTVDEVVENRTFTWHTGRAGYRLTAEHHLSPTAAGTAVELAAVVTGPLARPVWWLAGRTIRRYVELERKALKAHCEPA